MKKVILLSSMFLLLLGLSGNVSAVQVDFAYTADNIVNAWFIDNGSTVTSISPGANAGDWQNADTYSADLALGSTYEIVWQVEDYDDDWDIAGFLAEISSSDPNIGTISSSALWEVTTDSDFTTASWSAATEYAYNGASGDPWGTTVGGISSAAQWIWTDNSGHTPSGLHGWTDFQTGDKNIFVKATFETSSVPEPATMILLGTGLLGLVGLRRNRFLKK
jgi:hypothetical protein